MLLRRYHSDDQAPDEPSDGRRNVSDMASDATSAPSDAKAPSDGARDEQAPAKPRARSSTSRKSSKEG